MTYEELVSKIREVYENADARGVHEHIAIQVNIIGEAAGIFYIEVAERYVCVEPYDYHDRDALIVTDAEMAIALAEGSIGDRAAMESGRLYIEGNMDKVKAMHTKVKLNHKKKDWRHR